jgi:hypothetical protein
LGEIIPIEHLRRRKRRPRKEPERITPQALMELISNHSHCVFDQQGKCPLVVFTPAMAWELNQYFLGSKASEEDKGFHRCDQVAAAKPLTDHAAVEIDEKRLQVKSESEELE